MEASIFFKVNILQLLFAYFHLGRLALLELHSVWDYLFPRMRRREWFQPLLISCLKQDEAQKVKLHMIYSVFLPLLHWNFFQLKRNLIYLKYCLSSTIQVTTSEKWLKQKSLGKFRFTMLWIYAVWAMVYNCFCSCVVLIVVHTEYWTCSPAVFCCLLATTFGLHVTAVACWQQLPEIIGIPSRKKT